MKKLLYEDEFAPKVLCEDIAGIKHWYLEGVYAQAEIINKNKRIYPEKNLDGAMENFIDECLNVNKAVGELNHPPRIAVDPREVSHRILKLTKSGKNWEGKSLVLNTPQGKIVQALLEGGVRMGVSTRGFGTMKEDESTGVSTVQDDYKLVAIDCVFHPSAPDALVQGIMEGVEKIWDQSNDDIIFIESIQNEILATNRRRLEEQKLAAFTKLMNHFSQA